MSVSAPVPKWEAELWAYICNGDGTSCPLYYGCRRRKQNAWCFDEHITDILKILDGGQISVDSLNSIKAEGVEIGKPFKLVEMLAGEYLNKGNIHEPPVPEQLVSIFDTECPVEIRTIPLNASHGAIWHLNNKWIIQIASKDTPSMKRHTLFHEAFHILAHRQCTPVFNKREVNGGHFNEGLADYFAMCILMPRKWVRKKWADVEDLDRMAQIFNVPPMEMWIRLRQLDLM